MKAKKFDEYFDNNGDIESFVDLSQASHPNKTKRVNVDFPIKDDGGPGQDAKPGCDSSSVGQNLAGKLPGPGITLSGSLDLTH